MPVSTSPSPTEIRPPRRALRWFIWAALVIFLDQWSKAAARAHFSIVGEVLPVFPGFSLTLRYNSGAAFSFLADAGGWQHYFFAGLAIIVSLGIALYLLRHAQQTLLALALSSILGGAVGNLIDRLWDRQVTDFLLFYAGSYAWPAFNLADSAICLGAVLMLWDAWRAHRAPRGDAQYPQPGQRGPH